MEEDEINDTFDDGRQSDSDDLFEKNEDTDENNNNKNNFDENDEYGNLADFRDPYLDELDSEIEI